MTQNYTVWKYKKDVFISIFMEETSPHFTNLVFKCTYQLHTLTSLIGVKGRIKLSQRENANRKPLYRFQHQQRSFVCFSFQRFWTFINVESNFWYFQPDGMNSSTFGFCAANIHQPVKQLRKWFPINWIITTRHSALQTSLTGWVLGKLKLSEYQQPLGYCSSNRYTTLHINSSPP